MTDSTQVKPKFTDPFAPEECAEITRFENEQELDRLFTAFYATDDTDEKCRIGREFVKVAAYLQICKK